MECIQVNDLLDLLMDDALGDDQRQAVEAHCRACPQCAAALRETLQLKALFSQMEPEVDVPLPAQAKWRGAVRAAAKQRRRGSLRRWIASAAAAAVVLVGVGLAFSLRGAPKQDAAPALEAQSARELAVADVAVSMTANPIAPAKGVASNAVVYRAMEAESVAPEEAPGAVVETDGMAAEMPADGAADMADAPEAFAAEGAAAVQRGPACELALQVGDVSVACARIRDLAQEYEAVADVQAMGDSGANVYVEIAAENTGDFLSAVAAMDESGEGIEAPELAGSGQVLILLALHQ